MNKHVWKLFTKFTVFFSFNFFRKPINKLEKLQLNFVVKDMIVKKSGHQVFSPLPLYHRDDEIEYINSFYPTNSIRVSCNTQDVN